MVGLNHNTEQVRLVDELLQKQNKIKELVSNKNYILWLEEFTKSYPKFCDDDWLYKSDELSDRDTQMISYLGYFYECINQYAEKNYLSAYSDNIPFYNCFYHIKFNAILYKIGIVSGQGTYYYCQRIDEPNFDKCIYVTSAGQSLHFAQWFKVVEMMGYDWYDKLVHVPYGTVSINGEKLATRTGNVILLKDLFATAIEKVSEIINEKNPNLPNKEEVSEAVGVGSVVFYYLYNNRIKDINFIMKDALSFEGNTGPYAQYTYARTCGILEKSSDIDFKSTMPVVTANEESELLKVLSKFNEAVNNAIKEYEPSVITRYIIDVCSAFNKFYHNCQIVTAEDEAVRNTRIRLTDATKTVLGTAFGLICMKKTEKI